MMRSRLAATGAASLLALALAACGGSGSTTGPSTAPASSACRAGIVGCRIGRRLSVGRRLRCRGCAPASGTGQVQANAKGPAFDPASDHGAGGPECDLDQR